MKLYYYKAIKKIDATALIELLQKEILFEEFEIINVYETNNIIYIITSRNDLMEEIENLYPEVFMPTELPLPHGNVIFSIK